MSTLTIPYSFTNGVSEVDATTTNANNAAIVAAVNNIDNTNIGSSGIYASQIIPSTTAEGTFGGSLPYYFPANLFANGAIVGYNTTYSSPSGVSVGDVVAQRGSSSGRLLIGGASAAGILDFGVLTGGSFTFQGGQIDVINAGIAAAGNIATVDGYIVASASTFSFPSNLGSGDLVAQRGASTGVLFLGGASGAGELDFGITHSSSYTFGLAGGGYAACYGGLYTNSSDATLKTNVAPIAGALATIEKLAPRSYEWVANGQSDLGFVAQEVATVLPQLTRTDEHGSMGLVYTGITALNTAAIQEIALRLRAAGVAGF